MSTSSKIFVDYVVSPQDEPKSYADMGWDNDIVNSWHHKPDNISFDSLEDIITLSYPNSSIIKIGDFYMSTTDYTLSSSNLYSFLNESAIDGPINFSKYLTGKIETKEQMEAFNEIIDFFESLTYRLKLLKGMQLKRVDEICQNLPFMPGAKDTVQELKNRGYKVVCFSGGYNG